MKKLLLGNEAIARGAYEAGALFATGYPGTPSTEVLEAIKDYKEVNTEWAPNEKTALESAIGASIAGSRVLVTMKHVGLNVAADALFTLSYTGVNGGIVILTADDPGMHSSQNEQDNRWYGLFAKIPVLEPSDSGECLNFTKLAFEISEKFDTPVLVRTTTVISHSRSVAEIQERKNVGLRPLEKNWQKYTMLPANALLRRPLVEKKINDLSLYAGESDINYAEYNDNSMGIITGGASFQYVKEAFPDASVLKLGITYPLNKKMIKEFAKKVDKLAVIEELDPFLEKEITAFGIKIDYGKNRLPSIGELSSNILRQSFGKNPTKSFEKSDVPLRPPTLCPGCSHRGVFRILKKLRVFVSGDIGCYTLGALPPLGAMHSCICMGASIGVAHGMSQVRKTGDQFKPVAIIGDSTFFHSGVTGLINAVYNGSNILVIIQDNRVTAMTGGQPNPGTGVKINGQAAPRIDIVKLAEASGVKNIIKFDPYDLKDTEEKLTAELEKPGVSVAISTDPCVLKYKIKLTPLRVELDKCTGCKICLSVACMALNWHPDTKKVTIDESLCTGCTVCEQMCNFDAIGVIDG